MSQTHCAPGAFHDDDSFVRPRPRAMPVVQNTAFRKSRRELPLAVFYHLAFNQTPARVTDGAPLEVVQSNTDTVAQKSPAMIQAGFETAGRIGRYALFCEPCVAAVEIQPFYKWTKRLVGLCDESVLKRGRRSRPFRQSRKIDGCFRPGRFMESSNEFDHVAAGVAPGKTAPDVFGKTDCYVPNYLTRKVSDYLVRQDRKKAPSQKRGRRRQMSAGDVLQILHRVFEVHAFYDHHHVDGVEIPAASEASGEIRLRVGSRIEFVAYGAEEPDT